MLKAMAKPKILVYDVETAPILANIWSLWQDNVPLNMIEADWHLMAFAAKWLGDSPRKVIYHDQRDAKTLENDKKLLEKLWPLLDEADFVLTHNGKSFDQKKVNSRFAIQGMKPPSPVKHLDTKLIAKKNFSFTSNKLEYLTETFNKKYKKLKHNEFPGYELWKECMAGNPKAWKVMKKYNVHDVLALEELYVDHLQAWDNTSFFIFNEDQCKCGSTNIMLNGNTYTQQGSYQKYMCKDCGWHFRGTVAQKRVKKTGISS